MRRASAASRKAQLAARFRWGKRLREASALGDLPQVRALLADKARGNLEDEDLQGRTAAWLASNRGRTDVVLELLDQGASRRPGHTKAGPLILAAAVSGQEATASALLGRGAFHELEDRDRDDRTALWCAADSGYRRVVVQLLAAGADVWAVCAGAPLLAACDHQAMFPVCTARCQDTRVRLTVLAWSRRRGLTLWRTAIASATGP